MCKYMDGFLNRKRRDQTENTVITYRTALRRFYKFMKKYKNTEDVENILKNLTLQDVDSWIDYMLYEEKSSISTVNTMIATIKMFIPYLWSSRLIEVDFSSEVKTIKNNKKVKNIIRTKKMDSLTKSEFWSIINSTYKASYIRRNVDFAGARNRFLLSLLATTGLRIEQCLQLRFSDIEKKEGFYIYTLSEELNKTSQALRNPISGICKKYYEEYLIEYNKLKDKESDYVFLSIRGKKLTYQAAHKLFKTLCDESKIEKNITPHCLRAFFKTQASAIGMNEEYIKTIGGWSLGNIDSRYILDNYELDNTKAMWCEKILAEN